MNRFVKSAALAVGISLIGTAALAAGTGCCGKDKDGKMECCCDKMKGDKGAQKPDAGQPAPPKDGAPHEHQH